MCQPLENPEEDDDDGFRSSSTSNTSPSSLSPTPLRPLPLQFVAVGPGGTVPNPRTVRVHAIKEYHARKREAKRVGSEKVKQQRGSQLRPSQISTESGDAAESLRGQSERAEEEIGGRTEKAADGVLTVWTHIPYLPPSRKVEYRADLVPYAWFEASGPILYVNRSKWPFPTPFHVTGSDRNDRSGKSLTPRQSHWMPYTRTYDSTVVKGAVLDQNVLGWIGQSTECFQFRVDTIRWIQEQLRHPVMAVGNATIGAIMTFTMWTAGYANSKELSSHMDAIERIVNLKGGFLSFQADGPMTAKLTSFDSIIAVLTGKLPRFPRVEYFVSRPVTPETSHRMFHHESPLFGFGNFDNIISDPKNQEAIITLMKNMSALTAEFESQMTMMTQSQPPTPYEAVSESSRPTPTIPFIEEPEHSYRIPLLTLPLLSTCHDPDCNFSHNHILETLQSAAAIYSCSLSSTYRPNSSTTTTIVDFSSPPNELAFQALFLSFGKCTNDDFWLRYPGILLWVLLVGTAAARGKRESAWWVFYLSRMGSFSNAERWEVGSAAVRRFLEIQRLMREAG